MAKINFFEASNEVPLTHKVTLLSVEGTGFPHCSSVDLTIHAHSATGRVLVHTAVHVGESGTFSWASSTSPQRPCGAPLTVVAHDASGASASATTEVICPPV